MSNLITRRHFLAASAATGIALSTVSKLVAAATSPERKFYAILSLGRLGLHATFPESLELATKHGFEGLDPDAGYLASLNDDALHRLLDELKTRNLKFGAAGFRSNSVKNSDTFNSDLKKLPSTAAVLQRAGIWRINTWILPCSDDLTYLQNFRQHAERLRLCAQVLADHGQKLGLEYVSPRTLWRSQESIPSFTR